MTAHCVTGGRRGHTSAELMIVAGIVAVLAAVGILSFRASAPRYRLDQTAAELGAALRVARMQAVSKNRLMRVYFNTGLKEVTIWDDLNTNGVPGTGELETHVLDSAANLQLTVTSTQGVFDARGTFLTPSNSYLTVTLTVPSVGTRYVHVLPCGQVDCTRHSI